MGERAKNRIEYFDIAKGIGILCIIAGHMGIRTVDRIVYTFHVPIFFLISGYFLSKKGSLRQFAAGKVRALLLPYAVTGVILVFLKIPVDLVLGKAGSIPGDMIQTALAAAYGSGAGQNRTLFGIPPIGAIWFLPALFWAVLIVRILQGGKSRWTFLMVAIITYVSCISARIVWLPWDLQAGGAACVFVYAGSRLRECQFFSDGRRLAHLRGCAAKLFAPGSFKRRMTWVFAAGAAVLLLEYHFRIRVLAVRAYYKYGFLSILGAISISCAVIVLSMWLERTKLLGRLFLFFGEHSLLILCFHLIELNNAPWSYGYRLMEDAGFPAGVQPVCIYGMKLVFSAGCTCIVRRAQFLRKR